MTFPRNGLLREAHEIATGDTVMVAYLAPPRPGEDTSRVIRQGLSRVAPALGFLVVDPAQRKAGARRIGVVTEHAA